MAKAILHKPLDANVLKVLRDLGDENNDDFLNGLIDLFLQSVPPVLSELKTAVGKNDAEAVRQLAHRLRGYSANLGAWDLSGLCADLEQKARLLSLSGANELVRNLEEEFEWVKSALDSERKVSS